MNHIRRVPGCYGEIKKPYLLYMKRIGFQREDRGMIPIDETIESVCVDVADGVNTFTAYLVLAIVSCNGDFPDIAFVVCPVFEDMFVIVVPVFFFAHQVSTPFSEIAEGFYA